jgi:hypothetical protein
VPDLFGRKKRKLKLMIKGILAFVSASALAMLTFNSQAEVRLPKVFGSHMVLQQGKPVVIWGWADPGEKVEARIGEAKAEAKANAAGEWKLSLPAMKPGAAQTERGEFEAASAAR